jgi:hypothetical protein
MKIQRSACLQIVVIMFGFAALGQTGRANDISGLYVGGNVGLARIDYDNALYQKEIESAIAGTGTLDFTNASLRKRNAAWWVDAGYMVSPYVGIEADYLHFGALYNHVAGKYTSTAGSTESVIAATSVRSDGPALGLIFRLPLTESFDISLRLADYYGRTTLVNTLDAATYSTSRETANTSSLLVALGAAYTFAGHWSARIDYFRVNQAGNSSTVVKYSVDMATVGLSFTY